MLRRATARARVKALTPYFVGGRAACVTNTGEHVLLGLGCDTVELLGRWRRVKENGSGERWKR